MQSDRTASLTSDGPEEDVLEREHSRSERKRLPQAEGIDEAKRTKLAAIIETPCEDDLHNKDTVDGGLSADDLIEVDKLQEPEVSSTRCESVHSVDEKLVMAEPGTSETSTRKEIKKGKSHKVHKPKSREPSNYENEIDEVLEEMAWKNNLTAVNVKNILRHVITNKHVLAMVRKTMGHDSEDAENIDDYLFEPKLTRSKTKELIEKQANIPWPISPIKNPLVSPTSTSKLMEAEFSEDESSDEEYKPEQENEEEDKRGRSEHDQLSVEGNETVSASTVCDQVNIATSVDAINVDTIALRTRSKFALNDTPLESIEATLVAPDITVDMYDSECDDEEWKNFLKEFVQPINNSGDDETEDPEYNFLEEEEILDREDMRNDRAVKITKKELSELMAELFEAAEMELADLDEDGEAGESGDGGKSVKSGEYALNLAMNQVANNEESSSSLFTGAASQQLEEQMRMHVQLLAQGSVLSASVEELKSVNELYKMLLTELQTFAIKSTVANRRVSAFSASNLADAVNLVSEYTDKPLQISLHKLSTQKKAKKAKMRSGYGLTTIAMETLSKSKIFMYPELLPVCGAIPQIRKVFFTEAEDNLIAFGLDQFRDLKNFSVPKLIQENMIPTKTERQIQLHMKNQKSNKASDNPIKQYYQNGTLPPHKERSCVSLGKACAPCDQPLNKLPRWLQKRINATRSQSTVSICPSTTLKDSFFKLDAAPSARGCELSFSVLKPAKGLLTKTATRTTGDQLFVSPAGKVIYVPSSLPTDVTTISVVNGHPTSRIVPLREKACPCKQMQVAIQAPSSKRVSPLKHVSPILKKYSPKKMRKTGGNLRSNPTILPKLYLTPVKKDKRLIAPKPAALTDALNEQPALSVVLSAVQQPSKDSVDSKVNVQQVNAQQPNVQPGTSDENVTSPILDGDSQSDAELFEDEELQDNAEDLAALMAASSTIQSTPRGRQPSTSRKYIKQQKEAEMLLELLAPNLIESDPSLDDRDTALAQDYLQRVQHVTESTPEVFLEFLKILYSFGHSDKSVLELYKDVCEVLKDFPALCDEFSMFLLPEQAVECGKYMQHFQFMQMRLFLRKVEVYFKKYPQPLLKITKVLNQCKQEVHLGINHIKQLMQPVLRNQAHLMEEFLALFPDERPSESQAPEFEEVELLDSDAEADDDGFENVTLPDVSDDYGGKNCKCECHVKTDDLRMQNRIRHCLPCGIKFVDGRIYVQAGKALKPVQVVYLNSPSCDSTLQRSTVQAKPSPRVTPGTGNEASKHNLSPSVPISPSSSSSPSQTSAKESEEESVGVSIETNVTTNAKTKEQTSPEADVHGVGANINSASSSRSPGANAARASAEADENLAISAKNHSVGDKGEVVVLWTRDADRLILSTCQQMGATNAAFEQISSMLGNKLPTEVKTRLSELMNLFSVHQSQLKDS